MRLTGVPAFCESDFLGARYDAVRDAVKDLLAVGWIDVTPFRKRFVGSLGRGVDILRTAFCDLADEALVNGGVIVEGGTRNCRAGLVADLVEDPVFTEMGEMAL